MRKVNLILALALFFSISQTSQAENFALVMGGATHTPRNQSLEVIEQISGVYAGRGWQTTVLYSGPKFAADWKHFPLAVRPRDGNEREHDFTFANYEKSMDAILSKARPGDQVAISINAHGSTSFGKHYAMWGEGISDRSIVAGIFVELRNAYSTSSMFPKIEALLKKGVRVHLDTLSCYDGAVLKNISSLIDQYPGLLCVTTAASADGPAWIENKNNLYSTINDHPGLTSITERFRLATAPRRQISVLPRLMSNEGPVESKEYLMDYASTCEIAKFYPSVLEKLQTSVNAALERLDEKGQALRTREEKIRYLCSQDYNGVLAEETFRKIAAFEKKFVNHGFLNIEYRDIPEFFESPDGDHWFGCSRPEELNKEKNPTRHCLFTFYGITRLLKTPPKGPQSKLALEKFRALLDKHPEVKANLEEYKKFVDATEQDLKTRSCDKNLFARIRQEVRELELKELRERTKANPASKEAARLKACDDFKL